MRQAMAAGIVASTLRRRTLRQKMAIDAKYQAIEPGHISLSPTGSHPPSRSPSFMRDSLSRSPSAASGHRSPKGTRLLYQDFWPTCINPNEPNLRLVEFETFEKRVVEREWCQKRAHHGLMIKGSTLIPKANGWLAENADIHLVKCETIEKKVCSVSEVTSDSPMFVPKGNCAIYVKGLRLWYIRENGKEETHATNSRLGMQHRSRLWYIREKEGSRTSLSGSNNTTTGPPPTPIEVGYMNVIPKCLDSSLKYPIYENLPETYAAINEYLSESPLEGKILTIETISLKLPRRGWEGPEVDPDQTHFPDEYLRHVLYITRIYFVAGAPEQELIGAQDFLPEFLEAPRWYSIYGIYPKYTNLITAMQKAKAWMTHARNVRITNMQTLEAIFRGHPDQVHTGVNFVEKIESCAMVRFVRVTYVRPPENATNVPVCNPPTGLTYKTFIPCAVKVGMCTGAPQYEHFSSTWERARAWLKIVDKRVLGAETFYHPMNRVWHNQDGGETSVMHGEWTTTHRGDRKAKSRRQLVHVVRVYLEGDYTEPPLHHLPPTPRVEEVNDCGCVIQ